MSDIDDLTNVQDMPVAPDQCAAGDKQRLRIHVPNVSTTLTMGAKSEPDGVRNFDGGPINYDGFGVHTKDGHVYILAEDGVAAVKATKEVTSPEPPLVEHERHRGGVVPPLAEESSGLLRRRVGPRGAAVARAADHHCAQARLGPEQVEGTLVLEERRPELPLHDGTRNPGAPTVLGGVHVRLPWLGPPRAEDVVRDVEGSVGRGEQARGAEVLPARRGPVCDHDPGRVARRPDRISQLAARLPQRSGPSRSGAGCAATREGQQRERGGEPGTA